MQIRFYELTSAPLVKALPKFLEKFYDQKLNILLLCSLPEEVKSINEALWTYHPNSFLPHGTAEEGFGEYQPIWISTQIERPNKATVCVSLVPKGVSCFSDFDTLLYVFESNDAENFWALKDAVPHDTDVVFWKQSIKGGWENMPSATLSA